MRSAAIHVTLGALALTAAAVVPATAPHGTDSAPSGPSPVSPAPRVSPGGPSLPSRDAREAAGAARAARAAADAGIDWEKCPASQELPAYAECGEVTVPADYAAPDGADLRLTVSRKRATGPARQRQGPLIHNPGGPGADGMSFPLYATVRGEVWRKLNRAYDLIGYAPRGVGRSGQVRCRDAQASAGSSRAPYPSDEAASRSPLTPSDADKLEMRRHAAALAAGCARDHRTRLARFTTADNARDLDVLRAALHSEKATFTGTSYGAYLGSVYATLFPGHVRRLVLDSPADPRPERIGYREVLAQSAAFQHRWGDFTSWAARHHRVYGLGTTARAVRGRFDEAREAFDRRAADRRTADVSAERAPGSRELLRAYLAAGYGDESWPRLASALADFHEGDPRALTQVTAHGPGAGTERHDSDSAYLAVRCSEGGWPRTWSRWNRDGTALARRAPFHTWENLRANLPCAYWRGRPARPVDVRAAPRRLPPVLLLAATRDAATPYEGAVHTWGRLPGSSLVTEVGAGTHGVADGNECADRHLAAYLLKGVTPGPAADCPARPEPRALRLP